MQPFQLIKLARFYVLAFIFSSCTSLFYYPDSKLYSHPNHLKIKFKEVSFQSEDKTWLWGWHFPAKSKVSKGVIVQFHGNAQNMSSHYLSLIWAIDHGYDLFAFDYRGYGTSEGKPHPLGMRKDGRAAINYVIKNYMANKESKLIVYGQSLGGIIATDSILNSPKIKEKINLLILDSTFSSYREIAYSKLKNNFVSYIFSPLAYLLISDKTATKTKLGNLSPIPLIVLHGTKDQVVGYEFGKEIYDSYKGPKAHIKVLNANHLEVYRPPYKSYRKNLLDKIDLLSL